MSIFLTKYKKKIFQNSKYLFIFSDLSAATEIAFKSFSLTFEIMLQNSLKKKLERNNYIMFLDSSNRS